MDPFSPSALSISANSRRRCLAGITIMLVEDSLSASEALRMMAVASGARLRRADCLQAAERHLQLFRPNLVIVDLGLPDGSGLELVETLNRQTRARPAVIAVSGGDVDDWGDDAWAAGADALLPKPVGSIANFQSVILSVLPDGAERRENALPQIMPAARPGQNAVAGDLKQARVQLTTALANEDFGGLKYAAQFLHSFAVMHEDSSLLERARQLEARSAVDPATKSIAKQLLSQIDGLKDGARLSGAN